MSEIISTAIICFAMTLVGLALGFVLLKIQAG
uniref:Cytochrome b6-f complex subunit 7 n=1 Tax=Aureoumbra lagunensis TaxID=44058 RepID=C6KJ24_9STRA|nr:cytochrome b6-f complex subunit VII [Aureoumbra lagunensis]ACS36980.1 cytochrome b6-f complex subunit VII [Aureoumbra lagunensis]